jgi:hypothetical protein
LTASPPVSGMLKPIVIGGPDGASASATADVASIIMAAAAIPLMSLRNMLLPFLAAPIGYPFEIAFDMPVSRDAICNLELYRSLPLPAPAANQQQNFSFRL